MNTYKVIKTYTYTEEVIVQALTDSEAENIALHSTDDDGALRIYDDTLMSVRAVWVPDWAGETL